jgi:hypothetical protein
MHANPEPLESWNDTATRQAIVRFVETVNSREGTGYVPPEERVRLGRLRALSTVGLARCARRRRAQRDVPVTIIALEAFLH